MTKVILFYFRKFSVLNKSLILRPKIQFNKNHEYQKIWFFTGSSRVVGKFV